MPWSCTAKAMYVHTRSAACGPASNGIGPHNSWACAQNGHPTRSAAKHSPRQPSTYIGVVGKQLTGFPSSTNSHNNTRTLCVS